MNIERLAEEYVKRKKLLDSLTKEVNDLKGMLSEQVDTDGDVDEKGNRWLVAGKFLLQRQKRQPQKYLNLEAAEQWVKDLGVWDEVKVVREQLDEDKLLGFVYDNRRTHPEFEDVLEGMYVEPDPTWAFISPVEQKQYEY